MTDGRTTNGDSATHDPGDSPTMSALDGGGAKAGNDRNAPSPHLDDLFGDYSEQTGSHFG